MRGNKISRVDYNPSAKNGSEADASPAMPLVTLGVLIWSDWILVTNVELCLGEISAGMYGCLLVLWPGPSRPWRGLSHFPVVTANSKFE